MVFGTGAGDRDDLKDHGIVTGFFASSTAAPIALSSDSRSSRLVRTAARACIGVAPASYVAFLPIAY